jgi:glutamate synthase domain-containing protein 3
MAPPRAAAKSVEVTFDAKGVYYRELNEWINDAVNAGAKRIRLDNVNGQRYIGNGVSGADVRIDIFGVPGNDLAAFMDGPTIVVHMNGQDGIANTMNDGKVVVLGDAGDVLAYGMRGGKLFVKGDVGYRVGIHMKEYEKKVPVVVCGGTARDFLGEYMAGGMLVLLGMGREPGEPIAGNFVGTGMHGGTIWLRGDVIDRHLGKEVARGEIAPGERRKLEAVLKEYCADVGYDLAEVLSEPFVKLYPFSKRPYGKLYAY